MSWVIWEKKRPGPQRYIILGRHLYLMTSSFITQKTADLSKVSTNYCILEPLSRRGKNDYVPRKYINMIQSPHPSKISIRKPNHQGMHLGCSSLQTPPLLSIAYCVECRFMIIISSLHSKCNSSFASISRPPSFYPPCIYVFQIFTTALTFLLHTGHTSTCLAHSSHATTCPQS